MSANELQQEIINLENKILNLVEQWKNVVIDQIKDAIGVNEEVKVNVHIGGYDIDRYITNVKVSDEVMFMLNDWGTEGWIPAKNFNRIVIGAVAGQLGIKLDIPAPDNSPDADEVFESFEIV